MKTKSGFYGVYPVVFALFDSNGKLSRDAVRQQVASMIRHKVHGMAVLGLASEVNKLSLQERHQLMEWVLEFAGGKVPVAVTIAEPNVSDQIEFARAAHSAGASWVVLQPPPVKGVPEKSLIQFFGAVADKTELPVAIQNAPEYLGIGLTNDGLRDLNRNHPNVSIVKLEATPTTIRRLRDTVGDSMDIFNGRAGIDIIDSLRAGAVGIIPGGESFDILTKIFNDLSAPDGSPERAQRLYQEVLPLLVFLMESIDNFLVYGKEVLGHRLSLSEVSVRSPSGAATRFGSEVAERYATALGKL